MMDDHCYRCRVVFHSEEHWKQWRDELEAGVTDLGEWMTMWSKIRIENFPNNKRAVTAFAPRLGA